MSMSNASDTRSEVLRETNRFFMSTPEPEMSVDVDVDADVDNDGDVVDGRVSLNQNHDLDLLSPISLQNNHHNQNNFNTNLAVNHYGEFTIVLR